MNADEADAVFVETLTKALQERAHVRLELIFMRPIVHITLEGIVGKLRSRSQRIWSKRRTGTLCRLDLIL